MRNVCTLATKSQRFPSHIIASPIGHPSAMSTFTHLLLEPIYPKVICSNPNPTMRSFPWMHCCTMNGTIQPDGDALFDKHGYKYKASRSYLEDNNEDDRVTAMRVLGEYRMLKRFCMLLMILLLLLEFILMSVRVRVCLFPAGDEKQTLLFVGHDAVHLPSAVLGLNSIA